MERGRGTPCPEHEYPGAVLDRAVMPVSVERDVGEARRTEFLRELLGGAEVQDAGVDPVLAVREDIVRVELHTSVVDRADFDPFTQASRRNLALAVRGLAGPLFPLAVSRVATLEAENAPLAQRPRPDGGLANAGPSTFSRDAKRSVLRLLQVGCLADDRVPRSFAARAEVNKSQDSQDLIRSYGYRAV
jgi:hypothetical protein